MKRFNHITSLLFAALLISILCPALTSNAQNADAPKGFGFYNTDEFREYENVHGGAGSIKYQEYWGPEDYVTGHRFFRVVEIPPKSSIGEYRLADSDELILILSGIADVTINGSTGRLVGGTLVPAKQGGTLGVYNAGDEPVELVWMAMELTKGEYHPADLGNDLTRNRPEGMIPFPILDVNYWDFVSTRYPSHDGLGTLSEVPGIIDFGYFATNCHARFFMIPAGASIGYHTHFTNEEHFFVFSGSGRTTVNDITLDMNKYDCKKVGVGDTHGIYNNTDEDLVIFFTNLPMPGVDGWGKLENLGDNLGDR